MGKTRLISEFTVVARDAGVRVLTGACLELGADGLPFSPFTAMLRELVRETGQTEIAKLLSGSGRAVRELEVLRLVATGQSNRGNRQHARHLAQDGERARVQHSRQAGRD